MPIWRNKPSMPKVRASSGTIGTMFLPMFLSFNRIVRRRTNAIVVEISRSPVPSSTGWNASSGGIASGGASLRRGGQVSAERCTLLTEVTRLVRLFLRLPERQSGNVLVRDGNVEPIAEGAQVFL